MEKIKIESVHLNETENRYEITLKTDHGEVDLAQFPKEMYSKATGMIMYISTYHKVPATTKYLKDK